MRISHVRDVVRRAFAEFLGLPTVIIAAFVVLAVITFLIDRRLPEWLGPTRATLHPFLRDATATADLLSTIAGSLITVTSITISLLLIAVQQAAGALTAQVFDQFLRRRHNQFHFGFFVGLCLFTLVTLASVDETFNPVIGATTVVVLTVVALYLLVVLLYTTIDQMRPVEIIEVIRGQTLAAREQLRRLLKETAASPSRGDRAREPVYATRHGFVTHVDLAAIRRAIRVGATDSDVVLQVSIGSFVAFGDRLADVSAASPHEARELAQAVRSALHLERQRNIAVDPSYGIAQLEAIAWASISTGKSDPAPGILTAHALRDLLARWSAESATETRDDRAVVVYTDNTLPRLMDSFELLAVATSESMQAQSLVAVLTALTTLYERLPEALARRTEDLVLRILPSLGDHVLTAELDRALSALSETLAHAGRADTASSIARAHRRFAATIGEFGSRSTRGGAPQ